MNNIAVYPGSFDPVSYGHLSILHVATLMFDKVIIAIGNNPRKKSFIPINDRIDLIRKSITDFNSDIEIASFDGLLSKFCEDNNAKFIIRGLRSITDFEFELNMASVNADLNPLIHTIFIPTDPSLSMVSSSVIREIYNCGGKIPRNYTTQCVIKYLDTSRIEAEKIIEKTSKMLEERASSIK